MILTEEIKTEMLNNIKLDEEDKYNASVWGVITNINTYAFIGITDTYLALACIYPFNTSIMRDYLVIPFNEIKSVKIKQGLFGKLFKRKVLILSSDKGKLNISLSTNTFGSKLSKEGQINGINYIVNKLKSL